MQVGGSYFSASLHPHLFSLLQSYASSNSLQWCRWFPRALPEPCARLGGTGQGWAHREEILAPVLLEEMLRAAHSGFLL